MPAKQSERRAPFVPVIEPAVILCCNPDATFRTRHSSTTLSSEKIAPKCKSFETKMNSSLFTLVSNLLAIIVVLCVQLAASVAPTIDYSHNMRVLKLPRSTQVGELIYRLKGSDGDAHSQLMFGVSGIEARQLLDVLPVAKSWNEADVYLKSPLKASHYNLTVFISDGNKTTSVESTILVTNDAEEIASEPDSSSSSSSSSGDQHGADQVAFDAANNFNLSQCWPSGQQLSPFVRPTKSVFEVPENTQPGEAIGLVSVRESATSELPVRFELRGKGAERFAIKYVFGPRGQSRGQLQLAQRLDYERQNLFALKVIALNAWTNIRLDTRNVATLDIVVAVGDVQDTAPVWTGSSARSLRIANTMLAGELLGRVEALDGDYADQRPIGYALDAASPFAAYFDIDKTTGDIRLKRAASELASLLGAHSELSLSGTQPQQQHSLPLPQLSVFASELPDTSSYEHLWPPMFAQLELPLLMVDALNEPPQFYGGLMTNESQRAGGATLLHGYLREPSADFVAAGPASQRPQVQWLVNMSQALSIGDETIRQLVVDKARGRPLVLDSGLGSNGTFELLLEGQDAALFELDPTYAVARQTTFDVYVSPDANRSLFDRDLFPGDPVRVFQFELVARDFGSPQLTSRIKCLVELVDSNDHAPVFERDLYTFQVYESAPPGQLIGSIRAHDYDSRGLERIGYTSLTGKDSQLFQLDHDSGLVSLAGTLDREQQAQYLLIAEARDSLARSNLTKLVINVLDVNDNAPVFAQAHYDALLRPDGQFEAPLVVRAHDADEPNSANSQVAYEIIAGNQNEQFTIDSLSGAIYPVSKAPLPAPAPPNKVDNVPSILREPIVPFERPLDSAGKILPASNNREIEETTQRQPLRLNWPPQLRSLDDNSNNNSKEKEGRQPAGDLMGRLLGAGQLSDQMPAALDLLLNLDAERAGDRVAALRGPKHAPSVAELPASARGVIPAGVDSAPESAPAHFEPLKLPPVTTLVVRAHDFGIPIRSATCKVSIYNQALQSRLLSVILNGTVEQLSARKEAIERSFGALTGGRAQIESLEALSDSSSFAVARVRLVVPTVHHQLVDLTDLSGLMQALEYGQAAADQRHAQPPATGSPTTTYIVPIRPTTNSNLSTAGPHTSAVPGLYTDSQINLFALDSSALEKKLLIYIIIVGVCILALLVIWMVYSCCHEDKVKIVEKPAHRYRTDRRSRSKSDKEHSLADDEHRTTAAKQVASAAQTSPIGNNLAKPHQQLLSVDGRSELSVRQKPDHLSMFNGQVWFESGPIVKAGERRASSAPSNSLDSALHAAIGSGGRQSATPIQAARRPVVGQFFPNVAGYVSNLAAHDQSPAATTMTASSRRVRHRKVAPIELQDDQSALDKDNRAFEADLETGVRGGRLVGRGSRALAAGMRPASGSSGSCSSASSIRSSASGRSSAERHGVTGRRESVILESDQELLGFDSTGTPIIATHASARQTGPLGQQMFKAPAGATSYLVPLVGETVTTREQLQAATSKGSVPSEPDKRQQAPSDTKAEAPLAPEMAPGQLVKQQLASSGDKKAGMGARAASKESESKTNQNVDEQAQTYKRKADENALPNLMGELNERLGAVASSQRTGQKTLRRQGADTGDKQGDGNARMLEKEAIEPVATASNNDGLGDRDQVKQMERQSISTDAIKQQSSLAVVNKKSINEDTKHEQKQQLLQQRTMSEDSTVSLKSMQNRELLEKQSIFALTYSGIATDKLPV